jgi:methyl-accepting chemotaxis protein
MKEQFEANGLFLTEHELDDLSDESKADRIQNVEFEPVEYELVESDSTEPYVAQLQGQHASQVKLSADGEARKGSKRKFAFIFSLWDSLLKKVDAMYDRLNTKYAFNINKKIRLIITVGLAGIILVGGVSILQLALLDHKVQTAMTTNLQSLRTAEEMKILALQYDKGILDRIDSMSMEDKQIAIANLDKINKTIKSNLINLGNAASSESDKQLIQKLQKDWNIYNTIPDKVATAADKGYKNEALQDWKDASASGVDFSNVLDAIIDKNQKALDSSRTLIIATYISGCIISVLLIVLTILASSSLGIVTKNYILRHINQILKVNKGLAEGNLRHTVEVTGVRDEFGELEVSMKDMLESLRTIILDVRNAAEQVASAAEHMAITSEESTRAAESISATITEVADGASQQVERSLESTQLMDTLVESVSTIQGTVSGVVNAADAASMQAQEGQLLIAETKQQMEEIQIANADTVSAFTGLTKELGRIQEFVNLITEIARQTNLLALNAAIEAARAGEHGRGFAVVASEVRKLAENSSDAASKVREIVDASQDGMQQMQTALQSTNSKIETGVQAMEHSTQKFIQIVESVSMMLEEIHGVSQATNHIVERSQRVQDNINNVAAISEQSAAGMQEVSAATEQQLAGVQEISSNAQHLQMLANRLKESVQKFQTETDSELV